VTYRLVLDGNAGAARASVIDGVEVPQGDGDGLRFSHEQHFTVLGFGINLEDDTLVTCTEGREVSSTEHGDLAAGNNLSTARTALAVRPSTSQQHHGD
jgi:hypothetical protein